MLYECLFLIIDTQYVPQALAVHRNISHRICIPDVILYTVNYHSRYTKDTTIKMSFNYTSPYT